MPGAAHGNPAISVVMPVWNRAAAVREAVESVRAQDFADWELVVVDDGSDDGTAEVLDAIEEPRLRRLRLPRNRGASAARNLGVEAARGDVVSFLDSDDLYLPAKLGHVRRWFDAHPGHDVLIDSFRVAFPPETRRAVAARTNPELRDSRSVERAIFDRTLWKATPALSARRGALLAAGGFDETLARRQDMDLILRLTRSVRCASTSEVLWLRRRSAASISAQDTFVEAVLDICERHPRYRTAPEFRRGLARDLARHVTRLLGKGRTAEAMGRMRQVGASLGARETASLLGLGLVEMVRRSVAR